MQVCKVCTVTCTLVCTMCVYCHMYTSVQVCKGCLSVRTILIIPFQLRVHGGAWRVSVGWVVVVTKLAWRVCAAGHGSNLNPKP